MLGKDKPEAEHSAGASHSLVPASRWGRKGTVLPIWLLEGSWPNSFLCICQGREMSVIPRIWIPGTGREPHHDPRPQVAASQIGSTGARVTPGRTVGREAEVA